VGVWLSPSLGDVTFSAFDSTGMQLETVTGTAGNFVGIDRAANEIRFVSIVSQGTGFTLDDLTYGPAASGLNELSRSSASSRRAGAAIGASRVTAPRF
jgi:hypothetical protein